MSIKTSNITLLRSLSSLYWRTTSEVYSFSFLERGHLEAILINFRITLVENCLALVCSRVDCKLFA